MSLTEGFLIAIRWVHLVAAAAWVGGSLFYLFVLRPALKRHPESAGPFSAATAAEFRVVVDTSIFVLLATGVILTFNRLTPGVIGASYGVTLGVKIALSVLMFMLARGRRRRTALVEIYRDAPSPPNTMLKKTLRLVSGYNSVVILGLIIFLLSDLLKTLFEIALRTGP